MWAERKVFNDSHSVVIDLETALYYMAEPDGYDGSLQSRLWWLRGAFNNVFLLYFSTSLTFHPYLHLQPDPCKHALCKGHARLHASTSLQLRRGQINKSTEAFVALSDIDHLPTHIYNKQSQRQGIHARKACSTAFLNLFQPLLSLTFRHAHTFAHTYTHKAQTAIPGHPAHPLSGRLHGQRGQDSPYQRNWSP